MRELLSMADIVALPTYYREGLPRILLEAMAMARPIVASDWVGCREVVVHEENGLLVPVRDAAALSRAIVRLADSADLRASFGVASRSRAETELAEPLIVRRVLDELYEMAPEASRAGAGA
jgi:glycosyltransferase involved in cell wall biosynthesis